MTNRVDVLAVIRFHEQELRTKCGSVDNELQDVHAAVAELIEAARHGLEALAEVPSDPITIGKLTRALTRVEGA